MRLTFRPRTLLAIGVAAVFVALNFALAGSDIGDVAFMLVVFLLSPILILPLTRHLHGQHFRARPDLHAEGRWTITEETIRNDGEPLGG